MNGPSDSGAGADVYSEDGYYAVIPEWVLDAPISSNAVRLYACLRRYADQRTMHATPSRKTLAARLQVKDEKSVDRAIVDLQRIGAVSVIPRWKNEAGHIAYAADSEHRERTSNGYQLHQAPRTLRAAGGIGGEPCAPTPWGGGASGATVGALAGEKPQPVEPQPSLSPTERGCAHAGAHTREADDGPPQLALVAEPEKPAKGKRAKRTTPAQVPEEWEPSEELWRSTQETAPGIPRSEVAHFIDQHRSKGATFVDFDAAWRSWSRKWVGFGSKGSTLAGQRSQSGRPAPEPYRNSIWEDGTADASWDAFEAVGQGPAGVVGEITTRSSVVQPFRDDVVEDGWQ